MSLFRLIAAFVLAAGLAGAAPALAGDQGLYGGPVISRPGLPLDPQLLPANSGPGDCFTRRVTGPGGAYRWDRVSCDDGQDYGEQGWSGLDQWGYGRAPLTVEARGAPSAAYVCDRCAPAPAYACAPCNATTPATYYDQRVEDASYARVQGYQTAEGYAQSYGYARSDVGAEGDRYGSYARYAYNTEYTVSGRDEAGYLVWPGKRP